MSTVRIFAWPALLVMSAALRADVTLAPLFSDHAVLQQGKPVPVWGTAAPGEKVTVTYRDRTARATAAKNGRWIVQLAPLTPGAPGELVATGKKTSGRAQDVVVGEVWVCAGQSNMEFTVGGPPGTVYRVENADEEVVAAQWPLIRHLKVTRTVAAQPATTFAGAWEVCRPETVGQFTAVGYFFARDLQRRLHVPIGLINSTWGGTPIEAWLSSAALKSNPAFAAVDERWSKAIASLPALQAERAARLAGLEKEEAAAKAAGPAKHAEFLRKKPWLPPLPEADSPEAPRNIFNGMIHPLLPAAIRGILWYQGESNVGRAAEYRLLFPALITHWRTHWGQGDLPFYWVQLPNFNDPGDATGTAWAWLREVQARALALPNTGMVVTLDLGEPDNVHPRNKQEVGRRLALLARHHLYGIPGDWSGPVYQSATRDGRALRVRFAHADTGLIAHDKPLAGFEVAGPDRRFFPADSRIERDTLLVSAPQVAEPAAVRYAWANNPEANLFNGAGLPAAPFRSDDW